MSSERIPNAFRAYLPRLVDAYHRGLLIPFLGAGMSVAAGGSGCPTWEKFVCALEDEAGMSGRKRRGAAELVRRANHATRAIARDGALGLPAAVRSALYRNQPVPTPATMALARVWWPLVLSTNYDDLFARAYCPAPSKARPGPAESYANAAQADSQRGYALEVLGWSVDDCDRVLLSLRETGPSILWALHGFLPRDGRSPYARGRSAQLESELVIGHEAYQRIAHGAVHYRRAFAEVHRQRSFLFLGTSLSDVYLLGLFAEVQELYGRSSLPHFAMIRRGEADTDFLQSRFNILCIEYENHSDLPLMLGSLAAVICRDRFTPRGWTFASELQDGTRTDFAIERGGIPLPPRAASRTERNPLPAPSRKVESDRGECFVFGVAPDNLPRKDFTLPFYPFFGTEISSAINKSGLASLLVAEKACAWKLSPKLARHPELSRCLLEPDIPDAPLISRCAVVTAWTQETDGPFADRDVRKVSVATQAALTWAAANQFSHVHMPLLGTGESSHLTGRTALVEMIRGYALWSTTSRHAVALTIHVRDRAALFELTSGHTNVVELLSSPTVTRFWVEVSGVGEGSRHAGVERELILCQSRTSFGSIAKKVKVSLKEWSAEVRPSPRGTAERLGPQQSEMTLEQLGVVAGSTVRFSRNARRPTR